MKHEDLLKRLLLVKRNPELAQLIPQQEILSMLSDVMAAFTVLQTAIEQGKLQGPKGEPGTPARSLTPGVDYPTPAQVENTLRGQLQVYDKEYQALTKKIEALVAKVKDGKDAVITEDLIERVAALATSLVELPDFEKLVSVEVDAFWAALDEQKATFDEWKLEVDDRLAQAGKGGGGIGRNTVTRMINDTLQVVYLNNGVETRAKLYSSSTEPTSPQVGDLWAG